MLVMIQAGTLLLAWSLAIITSASEAPAIRQESAEALCERAAELAYNLEHDAAIALLRRAVDLAPDNPLTHRRLASVLWLHILFRRGAVTVDHYLGSFSKTQVDLPKPPPDVDAEFRKHVARAIELAERAVAARPKDAQAHYDLGAAVGLHASYVATVEGRLLAGFKAARRAYDQHEKVLALDPARKDAGLIVGTYRYIVSTLSLPMRLMAYVVGFGGGRERGIRMMEETARAGGDNRVDALFALALIYNRERRFDDALKVLEELRRSFPRNRLVLLEAGATALRAGRPAEAEKLLSEGLAAVPDDERRRIPGELGLWRYKRGAARAALGRLEDAEADLRFASGSDAPKWVIGRTHVELGGLALKRGDPGLAAREARQARALCEKANDGPCTDSARKLLRSADGR